MVTIIIANKFVNLKLFKTIKNISLQKFSNKLEIIIINKDKKNNLNYLKKNFLNLNFVIINENDKNISDAFNKGVKIAKNNFLFFMGAGDTFYDDKVLKDIYKDLTNPKLMMIIGKVNILSEKKSIVSKRFKNKYSLLTRLSIPHQGVFMNIRYFRMFGHFDTKLKFAMDYDLILRSFNKFQKFKSVDRIICNWRLDGIGKNKTSEILEEYNFIRKKNNILNPFLRKLILVYSKIKLNFKTYLKI